MKLIIGNKNLSSWSLRPWLVLKQAGIAFEEVLIALRQPDSRQRILAHSPSGKVPCLIDGDIVIWDSLAIAEYIAERHSELWPADNKARAVARAVSAEMHSGFTNLRTHMTMDVVKRAPNEGRTPEVEQDIARIVAIWNDCQARFGGAGEFLFGRFSIADAMYAPVCLRFQTYGVEPAGPAGVYLQTMLALPAMREWQAAALVEVAAA